MRLAFLGVTNAFALLLRLLPMSGQEKDAKILALRHQLLVLQRQLGPDRCGSPGVTGRCWRRCCAGSRGTCSPDTVLRWHRDMLARRHARRSRPRHPGRPPSRSIRALVLPLSRENSAWGYRRVRGELQALGVKVAASTVWEILHEAWIDPGSRAQLRHMGRVPAIPGRGPAGLRLLRDGHPVGGTAARARGDRARQPESQDPPPTRRHPG
jgi:transposase